MFRKCSIIALLLFPCLSMAEPARHVTGLARVIDGDTLDVAGQTVRLFGIDAPERDQTCQTNGAAWPCGTWAEAVLERAVAQGQVYCTGTQTDRYGRLVARCTAQGQDVGRLLVLSGAAVPYLRYSDLYEADGRTARKAQAGIWAGPLTTPEVHRAKGNIAAQTRSPTPAGCAIKGNVSANGRIYHLPGQRDYDATQINTTKGEAWFCTASQAKAAGFRPARR